MIRVLTTFLPLTPAISCGVLFRHFTSDIGTKQNLGLPDDESFYCPVEVKKYFQRNFKSIQQLISDSGERKDSDIFDISSELKNIDLDMLETNLSNLSDNEGYFALILVEEKK